MSLHLRQKLRASHVKRWHIVETTKQQTVAEHSFNVWVFAEAICDIVGSNDVVRQQVIEYALHHDLPEVILGDVPTPSKLLVNMERVEYDIDPKSVPPNTVVRDIVKLADVMDAIVFLAMYGVGKHAELIREERMLFGNSIICDMPPGVEDLFKKVCLWETKRDNGEGASWIME
jgi:hypothetical protein